MTAGTLAAPAHNPEANPQDQIFTAAEVVPGFRVHAAAANHGPLGEAVTVLHRQELYATITGENGSADGDIAAKATAEGLTSFWDNEVTPLTAQNAEWLMYKALRQAQNAVSTTAAHGAGNDKMAASATVVKLFKNPNDTYGLVLGQMGPNPALMQVGAGTHFGALTLDETSGATRKSFAADNPDMLQPNLVTVIPELSDDTRILLASRSLLGDPENPILTAEQVYDIFNEPDERTAAEQAVNLSVSSRGGGDKAAIVIDISNVSKEDGEPDDPGLKAEHYEFRGASPEAVRYRPRADGKTQLALEANSPGSAVKVPQPGSPESLANPQLVVTDTEGNEFYLDLEKRTLTDPGDVTDPANEIFVHHLPEEELVIPIGQDKWNITPTLRTQYPIASVEVATAVADDDTQLNRYTAAGKDPFERHAKVVSRLLPGSIPARFASSEAGKVQLGVQIFEPKEPIDLAVNPYTGISNNRRFIAIDGGGNCVDIDNDTAYFINAAGTKVKAVPIGSLPVIEPGVVWSVTAKDGTSFKTEKDIMAMVVATELVDLAGANLDDSSPIKSSTFEWANHARRQARLAERDRLKAEREAKQAPRSLSKRAIGKVLRRS